MGTMHKRKGFGIWYRVAAPLVLVAGIFAVSPVTAMADGNGNSSSSSSSTNTNGPEGNGNGNGGVGNNNGNGNKHNGDGQGKGNDNGGGNGGASVPETPYAVLFPLAIAAATLVVYKRRRKTA